jgi:hypothetical protein
MQNFQMFFQKQAYSPIDVHGGDFCILWFSVICFLDGSQPFWLGEMNLDIVLICISFMANISLCIYCSIYTSSFEDCLFNSFARLLTGLFVLLMFYCF